MMNVLIFAFNLFVFPGLLFCSIIGLLLTGVDRKLVARMQSRVGPSLLQPWYDFLKCCGKETIIPRHSNRMLYIGAPILCYVVLVVTALFIPVLGNTFLSSNADLIVILYLLTLAGVAIIIGSSASGSPFAGVGLSREMVAMISYELPFVLVILAVGRLAGSDGAYGCTFSLQKIAEWQAANGSILFHWSMIPAAIAMLFVIPCEIGMHPFDIAEAETEICEGTLAEYSGAPLALYKLAHSVKIYIMTALFCAMFLGGISTGIVALDAVILVVLCAVVTFVTMTVPHAVCARFKVEQVFKFYWTIVTGLALISLVLVWFGL